MWTAADARLLGAAAFRDRILRVLMEPVDRNPAGAVATAAEAASELARLGVTARQVHHGYDHATWDVMRAAVAMGQDIRIGLEDTTFLPDGSVADGERRPGGGGREPRPRVMKFPILAVPEVTRVGCTHPEAVSFSSPGKRNPRQLVGPRRLEA